MVNPIITLGAIAGGVLLFTAGGGIELTKGAVSEFRSAFNKRNEVSTSQKQNATKKSEIEALKNAEQSRLLKTNVASKSKFKPTVRTSLTQNFSSGFETTLSSQQLKDIQERPFTDQELADIEALNKRRAKSEGTSKFKLKQSGEEVVLQKRIQEELAKENLRSRFGKDAFVDGKLFAKSGFAGFIKTGQGALTESQKKRLDVIRKSIDPRNLSSAELAEIQANKIKNAAIAKERDARGKEIQLALDTKGVSQSQATLAKGAILRGGNTLNARALAKLQEQGLI